MDGESLAVDGHTEVVRHAGIPTRRLLNRLFDCDKHDSAVDAAFALDKGHNRQQIIIHGHDARSSLVKKQQTTSVIR